MQEMELERAEKARRMMVISRNNSKKDRKRSVK